MCCAFLSSVGMQRLLPEFFQLLHPPLPPHFPSLPSQSLKKPRLIILFTSELTGIYHLPGLMSHLKKILLPYSSSVLFPCVQFLMIWVSRCKHQQTPDCRYDVPSHLMSRPSQLEPYKHCTLSTMTICTLEL